MSLPVILLAGVLSVYVLISCAVMGGVPVEEAAALVTRTDYGKLITLWLESSPFPHKARANGYLNGDAYFPYHPHYDNGTVLVFVPEGFAPGLSVDLVVFLHGWYGTAEGAAGQFSLLPQFSESRSNALLVIPQGPWNAADSFGGKLEDKGGFEAFVGELLSKLDRMGAVRNTRLRSVTILAHSGAYHPVSKILENRDLDGKIKEVVLFDALFGYIDRFAAWIARGKGRFVAVFSERGGTAANTHTLMKDLTSKGIGFKVVRDEPASDRKLGRGDVLFVQSGLDHYGLLYRDEEVRRLLARSRVLRHYRASL